MPNDPVYLKFLYLIVIILLLFRKLKQRNYSGRVMTLTFIIVILFSFIFLRRFYIPTLIMVLIVNFVYGLITNESNIS